MDVTTLARPPAVDDSVTEVLRWRLRQLCRAGYEPGDALLLASQPAIDLHRAIDLVERGCPPRVAFRILF